MQGEQLVGKDMVVTFHYTLRNQAGQVLDSSNGSDPLTYLHGHKNIVPGLENALIGKTIGSRFNVTVSPAEGYGERVEEMVIRVPKSEWDLPSDVGAGQVVEVLTNEGMTVPALVVEMTADFVTLDGNHPLAGEELFFEIELTGVRAATQEELEHGHVHGPGDHHHH
jgi:FKBP-type peptidyl-prolyl cis-trans isomerase SlyD